MVLFANGSERQLGARQACLDARPLKRRHEFGDEATMHKAAPTLHATSGAKLSWTRITSAHAETITVFIDGRQKARERCARDVQASRPGF